MRYVLLTLSGLLVLLFVAGGLGSGAAHADNPNDVCADFDGDGQVSITDIGLVVQRFGMTEESPDWDPRFDLHRGALLKGVLVIEGAGLIDISDIAFTVAQFGDVCTVLGEKVSIETIAQGTGSGIWGTPPLFRLARNQDEWEALWEEHRTDEMTPPLPEVNFEEEMVAAVTHFATGFQVLYVTGIVAGEEEWVLQAKLLDCGSFKPFDTQPYHIVRFPRTELPVSLSFEVLTPPCGARSGES